MGSFIPVLEGELLKGRAYVFLFLYSLGYNIQMYVHKSYANGIRHIFSKNGCKFQAIGSWIALISYHFGEVGTVFQNVPLWPR